jgi:hypothetical protein
MNTIIGIRNCEFAEMITDDPIKDSIDTFMNRKKNRIAQIL